MTSFRRTVLHRDDQFELKAYADFLKTSVYPAIDELRHANLIYGYDFLTHPDFDLRMWLSDGADVAAIRHILARHGLQQGWRPEEDAAPAEVGEERRRLLRILNLLAEVTRELITSEDPENSFVYAVHYLGNQMGMNNLQEVRSHIEQAAAWLDTVMSPPKPREPNA